MVDLRAELRPFVEDPARAPLPMSEIATRARRRRLRKRSAAATLALGVVGLTLALTAYDPATRVTTTAPESAPTSPQDSTSTTPAPSTTAAPDPPSPPPDDSLVATPGIKATATTTSSWDTGRCIEIHLTNTTPSPIAWEVRTTPPGPITTYWNATPTGTTFHGESWNAHLPAGLTTTFGFCVET